MAVWELTIPQKISLATFVLTHEKKSACFNIFTRKIMSITSLRDILTQPFQDLTTMNKDVSPTSPANRKKLSNYPQFRRTRHPKHHTFRSPTKNGGCSSFSSLVFHRFFHESKVPILPQLLVPPQRLVVQPLQPPVLVVLRLLWPLPDGLFNSNKRRNQMEHVYRAFPSRIYRQYMYMMYGSMWWIHGSWF